MASSARTEFCPPDTVSIFIQPEGSNKISCFSLFVLSSIKTRVITHPGLPMPSSSQLLALPNLQRNLLFAAFLKTPHLAQFLKGHAVICNSPSMCNAIALFCTYVVLCNFYAEKLPPYNEYN